MNVLVVDIGGASVKLLATGETEPRQFPSGPALTTQAMVAGVKAAAEGWKCDIVAIGYPGQVVRDHPVAEPHNLAAGWVGFDYKAVGGGNVQRLKSLPPGCREGDNANAFIGGFRLWEASRLARPAAPAKRQAKKKSAR